MAKQSNKLTVVKVKSLKAPGRHSDGENLYLHVAPNGRKTWRFMYKIDGRQREGGFGSFPKVTLAQARAKAEEWRRMIAGGVDPLEAKKGAGAGLKAATDKRSFGDCVDKYVETKGAAWRAHKYRTQWRKSLLDHAASLWSLPVNEIAKEHVLGVLRPLWARLPDMAARVRGRIKSALDFAVANGWREPGPNPAAWRGNLIHIFPRPPDAIHHKALPYSKIPTFVTALRGQDSTGVRALEFVILTATRIGEVLEARWEEIDVDNAIWTIPAGRMKAGRAHRVPLAPRALDIIAEMAAIRTGDYVFAGSRGQEARRLREEAVRLLEPM